MIDNDILLSSAGFCYSLAVNYRKLPDQDPIVLKNGLYVIERDFKSVIL